MVGEISKVPARPYSNNRYREAMSSTRSITHHLFRTPLLMAQNPCNMLQSDCFAPLLGRPWADRL
jgi:hypothetical protein